MLESRLHLVDRVGVRRGVEPLDRPIAGLDPVVALPHRVLVTGEDLASPVVFGVGSAGRDGLRTAGETDHRGGGERTHRASRSHYLRYALGRYINAHPTIGSVFGVRTAAVNPQSGGSRACRGDRWEFERTTENRRSSRAFAGFKRTFRRFKVPTVK